MIISKTIPRSILVIAALLSLPGLGVAQTPSVTSAPTSDQLEVFRNLPPDQQKALLDALGSRNSDQSVGLERDEVKPRTGLQNDAAARDERLKPNERPLGPPRVLPGSTLLLSIAPVDESILQRDPQSPLLSRRERILAGNPYRLNNQGELNLLLLPKIQLAGLSALEIAQRLNADPKLFGLKFSVTILPLSPAGDDALKLFGSDLFEQTKDSFRAPNNIPVPLDYVVGPGDQLIVEFVGKRSGRSTLVVNRDGRVSLPEFGPMQVAGEKFDTIRSQIERRVAEQAIGVGVTVTMGQLRSIMIFVLGDVSKPGSCTVSAMSTITNALLECGGISSVGSLRNVALKRGGSTVGKLDLYDLLLNGDTSNDRRVEAGDVVFVPPLGDTVSIRGEVRRPAIYEVKNAATLVNLVALAGGLTPTADASDIRIERIDDRQQRVIVDIDLRNIAASASRLRSGDAIMIPRVHDELASGVELAGHVQRPGKYSWHEGMQLTDLLGRLDALKESADQRYIMIRREQRPSRRIEVLSADAQAAFESPNSTANPFLQPRDRVLVFGMEGDRGAAMTDIMETLRLQARDNKSPPVVSIQGRVRAPGEYPLEPGMKVSDLLRAGGGLDEAAYRLSAELSRYEISSEDERVTSVTPVDLNQAITGTQSANFELRPFDVLVVKQVPEWSDQGAVTLTGEVRFPGQYPIRKGERLSSIIARAGGLTEHAFPEGAVFTRVDIREQERRQIEALTERMRADLAAMAVRNAQTETSKDSSQALSVGQSLLSELNATKPIGRLVIDLASALERRGAAEDDIELRAGDVLNIPRLKQYVTVVGEVQNATAHIYKRSIDRDGYVALSGGATRRADRRHIYVVRADGSVANASASSWFSGSRGAMRPGDTVVVPLDTERMRPLPLWTAVTTVIYNLAIAAAALNSF